LGRGPGNDRRIASREKLRLFSPVLEHAGRLLARTDHPLGFIKLIDYFRFRNVNPAPRCFPEVKSPCCCSSSSPAARFTVGANISPNIGQFFGVGELIDLWTITGNNYDYTDHVEADVTAGSVIDIFNLYGNVDIRPGPENRIILDVKKTVRAANQAEADGMSKGFTFSIEPQPDGTVRIRSNKDEGADPNEERRGTDRQRYKSNLTIQVPAQAVLKVTNRFGSTDVAEVNGNHEIKNSFRQRECADGPGRREY
jgi:hypothetical protein